MLEIIISGRGGQGAVLASQILAGAFFSTGMAVQAFPSFGAERRGAPVSAYLRVDREEMTLRCNIYSADWIILLDAQQLSNRALISGLKAGGALLINSAAISDGFDAAPDARIFLVDARAIALDLQLGSSSSPIMNTAMAGAFAGASGLVPLERVIDAIGQMVPVEKEKNAAAARAAYESVREMSRPAKTGGAR